ncbi:hypothetical protein [Lactococcus taiwanensis]|uniref:hypothetical protein n=1 Tax=Lactococcus taiwanensis TaxID=1151742 RepID=UPI003513177B
MSEQEYQVKVEMLYASGNYETAYLGYSSLYNKYLFHSEFKHRTLTASELNTLSRYGQNYWSLAVPVEDAE